MHHAPSENFFSRVRKRLFRTLSYFCRGPDKFPRSDHGKITNLRADDADYGLTDSGAWILIYALSRPLRGV